MKKTYILMTVTALLLSACGKNELEVHEPWARTAMHGENGVVYMIVHNHTDVDDELTGASSDVAEAVEVHETVMADDGVMQMVPQAFVPLAAEGELIFEPGGLHIMLVNLNRDLKAAEAFSLTLHFREHPDLVVEVKVKDSATGVESEHHMP